MRRVHARAAVKHRAVRGPESLVSRAQLSGRLETTISLEVFCKRRAQRARDVAGFRIDRLRFPAVSLAGTRVDERHAAQHSHVLEVEHTVTGRWFSAKRTVLRARRICRQRSPPSLEPAVEDRPRGVAKVAE